MNSGFKAHYFKELAELEAGNFWFRARNKLILLALRRYAPGLTSFLEIGCGTGFVLSAISKQFPGARISGSEYWEEGLAIARLRVPGAELARMDARQIPYESELDAVGAFDVLEHIEEDETVLRQIWKALKPGGIVLITVPQHRWMWSATDEYACHVRRYSAKDLRSKVEKAGFTLRRMTSFVTLLLPLMMLSRLRMKCAGDTDPLRELRIGRGYNAVLESVLAIERGMIRAGMNMPFGGSLLVVARKSEGGAPS